MFRANLNSFKRKARTIFGNGVPSEKQAAAPAHEIDAPRTIESLLPEDQRQKDAQVEAYLLERGLTASEISFDPEPWNSISFAQRLEAAQHAHRIGKKNLILVYERACGDSATFRYFGYNIAQRLEHSESWHGTYLFVDELAEAADLVAFATAIVLIRCRIRPELIALAEAAKQRALSLAYLMDDNALGVSTAPHIIQLMATDPTSKFEQSFWKGATTRFHLASQLADCFFAPISYYAGILEQREGKPAYVIHSSLNDEQVLVAQTIVESMAIKARKEHFDIGYFSGTSSHQNDFALVHDALVEFLSTHDEARLVLGGQLTLSDELYSLFKQGKVIVVPHVDYVTLQYLQAAVDLVLAPLLEDEFTNCKSALKVFEAGVVGTPACASPTFAYGEAIESGVSGMVCRAEDEWYAAFDTLYRNRDEARKMGNSARSFALSRYYGDSICAEIEKACEALAEAKPSPIPSTVRDALAHKRIEDWDNPFEANLAFVLER